jgi:UDP-N-acetylmuramate--alanine ligase
LESKHYYFIGLAGIGMCGAARLLLQQGHKISGSDSGDVGHLKALIKEGVTLYKKHKASNIAKDVDEVVYTVAVPDDNPELREARNRKLPIKKYAQIVGEIMALKKGICVAGAHGKTTTASMLAWILKSCGKDPSFIIGAHVPQLKGTSHSGTDLFVLESCEFDRSFHHYRPEHAVITNIDVDHLDYYKDIYEIQESFRHFASLVPEGCLLMNGDDAYSAPLIDKSVATFGFLEKNDFVIHEKSVSSAIVKKDGEEYLNFELLIPGKHNLMNATAAGILCLRLGCKKAEVEKALGKFKGAERRFQILKKRKNFVLVDDYAHHPEEIRPTIRAAREAYPDFKIIVVFQPHQHSRTRFLLEDFAWALSEADLAVLPDIYFVRDSQHGETVTSLDLVKAIRARGGDAEFVADMEDVPNFLKPHLKGPSLVFLMGAGTIWKLGDKIGQK